MSDFRERFREELEINSTGYSILDTAGLGAYKDVNYEKHYWDINRMANCCHIKC